jgi:hypothetical protein
MQLVEDDRLTSLIKANHPKGWDAKPLTYVSSTLEIWWQGRRASTALPSSCVLHSRLKEVYNEILRGVGLCESLIKDP